MTATKPRTAETEDLSEVELEMTRTRLASELWSRIRVLEARYELPSDKLEQAVNSGSIRETAEVAEWIVLWRTLRGLRGEGSSRLE